MEDNYSQGLTDLAASLRTSGVGRNAGCAGFVLRARDELDRLRAIVNGMLKTGDDVPIVLGGTYWEASLGEVHSICADEMGRSDYGCNVRGVLGEWHDVNELFSTKEAAESAREVT